VAAMKSGNTGPRQTGCLTDLEDTLKCLEGRWKLVILSRLCSGAVLRFSQLERAIPDVSQKMLIQQLRHLERDGIVSRIVHHQIPPKVEYAITAAGNASGPVFMALLEWAALRKKAGRGMRKPTRQAMTSKTADPEIQQNSRLAELEDVLKCLEGRWKLMIVAKLCDGAVLRFSELERAIPDVSQKMLIQQLRELERDGIVSRTVHHRVPPKVDYAMTEIGKALDPVFRALLEWAALRKKAGRPSPRQLKRPVTALLKGKRAASGRNMSGT
jgi:DNA-binding HxlR family transcriptional regulator